MNDLNRFECIGRLGQDRYTTEIVASEMQMLGRINDGIEEQGRRQAQAHQADSADNAFEDDIPF